MSDAEPGTPLRFGAIIVVGGGCYGGYYVRQLHRAARARAIVATSLVVVDRDAECAVARSLRDEDSTIETRVVVADWRAYFGEYLTNATTSPESFAADAIVPSPLMPHLMGEWLVERAKARWPDRVIETKPVDSNLDVRWQRDGADGTRYVSFADWMCPINCVEPRTCPHTRETRDWSLPPTIAAYATSRSSHSAVLHCRHRAYGVGMFDTSEVLAAEATIRDAGAAASAEVLIGTASHCHGAITRLVIGPLGHPERGEGSLSR